MSSTQLGRAIVSALVANGCRHIVLCPGSRSTPVALALAEINGQLDIHTRTDERVAAFTALGMARIAGLAAVVVTSGTAVGNLLPAVMEARHSGIGLLVITADRPATLVGSGANQTTWQRGIFAGHALDCVHLASTDAQPRAWTQMVGRACLLAGGARTGRGGPVQINAAFTEPFFEPDQPRPVAQTMRVEASGLAPAVEVGPARSVVLVGDAPPDEGRRARLLAESARLPLLAEPSSNARQGECAISCYREILDTELGGQIDRVLLFGHPTLSRPVSRLLAREDVQVIAVGRGLDWSDPGWRVGMVVDAISHPLVDPGWLAAWQRADAATRLGHSLDQQSGTLPSGLALAHAVVSSPTQIMLGASNPIRDADLAPICAHPGPVWANRGLAGIDGICSTAAGIALASGQPITVLVGDISFLHDIGALHIPVGEAIPQMRIVVADDGGGSIFATLEVGDSPALERFFRMPHGRDLAAIAAGFGWPAARLSTIDEVIGRLATKPVGIEVLVVDIQPR